MGSNIAPSSLPGQTPDNPVCTIESTLKVKMMPVGAQDYQSICNLSRLGFRI